MPKLNDTFNNNSEKVPVNRTGTSSVYNPFMEINKGFDIDPIDDFITSETGVFNVPLRLQDDYKTYIDRGIFLNDVNTLDELNKERAINQSHFEQFGNFLMQAGVGEVVLGTLEGFGNIWDGTINLFSGGDNYDRSDWTEFWEKQKEDLKNNFAIYRENPNETFDFGDFGYWMEQGVNAATTLSLMLPAAGWAKGLSTLGKLSKLNKVGNWAIRGVSRGLAKAGTKVADTGRFGAIKSIAGKAGRIEAGTKAWGSAGMQALLSRTGENYMEAKVIYDDIYESSLDNLNNMSDDEFAKFLANNKEFENMSKDDIAKEIARKSANKTFYNDYWMLVNDVIQFKALGSLFGKGPRRVPTASERIAAENAKRTLAGKSGDDLIKDNLWNRTKEHFKYAFKNPKESFTALNTQEGFEEMFQGIQSEKGMEVAAKYFDSNFTPRTIANYLSDGSIWEQGFWGMMGAIVYNTGYSGVRKASRDIEGLYKKKHLTAEQYENWKRSEDKISIENINNVTARAKQFAEDMQTINSGKNPHKFKIDTITGELVIKEGVAEEEEINEEEKDLLKQQTIDKFVTDVALDSVDNGTYELFKEIIGGTEFDKYISDNGYQMSSGEKALSQQIVSRMEEVSGIYNTALNDIYNLTDSVNPYIVRFAARNITRNKLMVEDYNNHINNVNVQLNNVADINSDYLTYEERVRYNNARKHLNNLQMRLNQYTDQFNEGKISKSAYLLHKENINKARKEWLNYLSKYTTQGTFDSVREALKNEDNTTEDVLAEFDKFVNDYNNIIKNDKENRQTPTDSVIDLINKKINIETKLNYTNAQIPITKEEHQQLYNEFELANDQMAINRINDYIDLVKNYLRKADDFDIAYQRVLNENTGDKKVDEALTYLKYGYFNYTFDDPRTSGALNINLQFSTMIEGIRNERNKVEETNEAAEKDGLEIPTNSNLDNSTSTGEETEINQTNQSVNTELNIPNPVSAQELQQNNDTSNIEIVDETPEKTEEISEIVDIEEDKTELSSTEEEIIRDIDQAFNTEEYNMKGDAIKYIQAIGSKEAGRIDDISRNLDTGDKTKYEALIKEIINFLKSRGYKNENAIESIAKRAFVDILGFYASSGNTTPFGRLASALARGFTDESAKKYSVTQLLDGEALNETLDSFLEEYSKIVGGLEFGENKYLINLESLFNYLLNDDNVSRKTAIDIYNNIMKFISINDESKYIFTGFQKNKNLSATEYFNKLNHYKAQVKNNLESMHINPLEVELRSKDYEQALIAANNGEKTYLKEERDNNGNVVNLGVYVLLPKGKRTIEVKVGNLRAVQTDEQLKTFKPVGYRSGFKNVITVNGKNNYSLDCDDFFNAIIYERNTNKDAKTLFEDLASYYISVHNIILARKSGQIKDDKELNKQLNAAMSDKMAERIMSNPIVKKLIEEDKYRFFNINEKINAKARKLAYPTAAILFKGMYDGISTISSDLEANYKQWKESIYRNYTDTYNLQKSFNNENETVNFKLDVNYEVNVNKIKDPKEFKNVGDLAFDIDPNSKNHTPLVYIQNGKVVDEYGNDYGDADVGIYDNSMGFLIYNENGVRHIAYCVNTVDIKGTEMAKALRNELTYIINDHLNNTDENPQKRYDNFIKLRDKLFELFGVGGLFYTRDIKVVADRNNGYVGLKDANGRNIITLFRTDKQGNDSHNIGVYNAQAGKEIFTNDLNRNGWNSKGEFIDSKVIKEDIRSALDYVAANIKLNRSSMAVTNKGYNNSSNRIFRRENGKFIVTLGRTKEGKPKEYVYENYGDFVLKNRGFVTDVYNNKENEFVTRSLDTNNFTITGRIKDESDTRNSQNTNVSDLLYINPNEKRKTVDTEDVLLAAGVEQDAIDVLLGTKNGVPILSSRIYTTPSDYVDDGETNAFYKSDDKNVYITDRGAAAMNNNPRNAIRLLIHENIHRLFDNKRKLSKTQRDRIITELKEVYEYVRAKLNEDLNNGNITNKRYDDITKVLDKATSYGSDRINMEEFLCESLTQPVIVDYLNNTEYKENVNISGIKENKKTIFQKIIDIILKLFGINNGNIKNNSILAKEYLVLSKTTKATTDKTGLFAEGVIDKSPVEGELSIKPTKDSNKLDVVKKEIDEVINGFNKRVKRSNNFEEDHIYYIDGKPADYSVTQKIHGKKDIGVWGVPSSLLGNTADVAARVYFENDGNIPDNYHIPNITDEENSGLGSKDENSRLHLKEQLDKIKSYLDDKFGKDKYRVITSEFPIAATIVVNGQEKTIAGTMDMLVYTSKGDIYIYDFKTKRIEDEDGDGNFDDNTLIKYKQQLNIYKELIETNYPQFKGRIKLGGLIKFNVYYPKPSKDIKYRENPNSKNQLQVDTGNGFKNIQDSLIDYTAPFIPNDLNYHDTLISVTVKKYGDEIKALPKLEEVKEIKDIEGRELLKEDVDIDLDLDLDDLNISEDEDIDIGEFRYAATELLDNTIENSYEKEFQDILAKAPRDKEGKLLAPNGKPSNLTEKQYVQVRTKEFKEWFGDWENDPQNVSKVVDENGEPLVVYHGTNIDNINEFDRTKIKEGTYIGTGTNTFGNFFTDDYNNAKGFADVVLLKRRYGESTIYKTFINIRNPLYFDTLHDFRLYTEKEGHYDEDGYFISDVILPNNYDGVIVKRTNDSIEAKEFVAPNPNQIKSADANIGTFSKQDNNIYKSATELLDNNKLTRAEIYAPAIVEGSTDNVFGVTLVNDISEFVSSFPQQYRENIRQILDSDELNYTCM